MSTGNWRDEIGPALLVIQIVVAALTVGCLTFTAVAVFFVQTGLGPAAGGGDEIQLLTYMVIPCVGMAIVLRTVVPRMIESASRKRIVNGTWQVRTTGQQPAQSTQLTERLGDAGKLLVVLNTRTLIAGAILEGSAFFALVAYMVEQSPMALGAAIVMIVGVALHFPTRSSATHWIEDQLVAVEQLRQFGS